MFNSLRYRFLFWLIAFVLFTASLTIPLNYIVQARKDRINYVVDEIKSLHLSLLKLFKVSDNFLYAETVNPVFFISGKSKYLDEQQILAAEIKKKLLVIDHSRYSTSFNYNAEVDQIRTDFDSYSIVFDSLVYLIFKHGYKNFGVEGEMIDYVNTLEKSRGIDKMQLLQVRRNEKDYFLRRDKFYIENYERLTDGLIQSVRRNRVLSRSEKSRTVALVNDYRNTFRMLVNMENKIGQSDNKGLRSELNEEADNLHKSLSVLYSTAMTTQKTLLARLKLLYIGFIVLAVLIAIMVSFLISKHILVHLEKLTGYISKFTENNFIYNEKLELKNPSNEIYQIYKEFRNLIAQLYIRERQRDKALHTAEENELRYRELTDMLPQSIYETDELGNFTYVNKAWYKKFGYSDEDMKQGLNLIETVISESNDDILGKIKLENSNFVAIRKDGSRFPASVYSDNVVLGDRLVGKRGIIIDVTERNLYISALKKETHKAQTSDKLKSSFLANMSHEIRTPMNSIIGFSSLLGAEEIPDEQKKSFVNYIRSSGELLMNLIDDIIDIAKIEAGEIKVSKKECNVTEMMYELYKTFDEIKNNVGKTHISLKIKTITGDFTIKTDPFRLKQVMSNLISNAIKFTDKGSIEFGCNLKNEKFVEFYVRDTGVGLSRDEIGIIFERFKRTTHSEEQNIVGTGLGLAISKNLVELMDGEMWVDSVKGGGTTFYFTLPYIQSSRITGENLIYETLDAYNWQGKTILIVEDDEQSFYFLNELLRRTGARIERSVNGEEAIQLCKNTDTIDLVLMDIQMPKVNGYEATREIRKYRNELPIIAQTAYAMSGDKEKSIMAGCDDYITKPLNMEIILPKINQLIHRQSVLRSAPGKVKRIKDETLKNEIKH